MGDFSGLLLMLLGASGFAFGLVSFVRSVRAARASEPEGELPGWKTVLTDQSWITSSAVFALGLSLREGLDWGEGGAVLLALLVSGLAIKLALKKVL